MHCSIICTIQGTAFWVRKIANFFYSACHRPEVLSNLPRGAQFANAELDLSLWVVWPQSPALSLLIALCYRISWVALAMLKQ